MAASRTASKRGGEDAGEAAAARFGRLQDRSGLERQAARRPASDAEGGPEAADEPGARSSRKPQRAGRGGASLEGSGADAGLEGAALLASIARRGAAPAAAETARAALRPEGAAAAEGGEAASRERRAGKAKPELSVTDLRRGRRGSASSRGAEGSDGGADSAEQAKAAAKPEPARVEGDKAAGRSVRELDFDLAAAGRPGEGAAGRDSPTAAAPAPRGEFSRVLAERLEAGWNTEIVKTAHIVLKDGDSGTIRLRLNPESLGGVKIELNLSEKHISGRIVVESDEAKSAFEKSLAGLRDAFQAGGFETASLEVSVGQGGAGGSGARGGEGSEGPFYSERLRSSAFESGSVPATGVSAGSPRSGLDILA